MRDGASWRRLSILALALTTTVGTAHATAGTAGEAPGAPGEASAWTTGAKQGIGTASESESKLWYTLGKGVAHEVYYPQLDVPNVQDLQFLVTDGATFTDNERDHTTHETRLADPRALKYQQINTDLDGRYRITKTYVTDPASATMLVRTRFEVLRGGPLRLYVSYNPSLNGSGMQDTGRSAENALLASDGEVSSAMIASSPFSETTTGYSGGASDPYRDLMEHHELTATYDTATTPGNIVQAGQIAVGKDSTFTLALGFGASREQARQAATGSLRSGFEAVETQYADGWKKYLDSLAAPPKSVTSRGLRTQYDVARMVLRAHEDKTYRGAFIASSSIPWGQAINGDACCTAGYHAVWARDLYHHATASIAAGDRDAANRALNYLLEVQQNEDGSFPQNTWLDGRPVWGSIQMDEVAFPIVLAWQLGRTDARTWGMLRKSAEYIVEHGPDTEQERWEEERGFSPSTIAAEIAGLVCAADMAAKHGDTTAQRRYLSTADEWYGKLDSWTFTNTGPHGDGRYYLRIDGDGDPDNGQRLELNNGGGSHDERAIVDPSFLELVRLGVRAADDPSIVGSLAELDANTKVDTPHGPVWYRYNHDGYGETAGGDPYTGEGVGRLWPLLTGERGQYELAAGRDAGAYLETMAGTAGAGYLLPEQVWDRTDAHGFTFGEGTGSATPLSWAMGQFVRLAHSIDAGRNVETPSIVAERYVR